MCNLQYFPQIRRKSTLRCRNGLQTGGNSGKGSVSGVIRLVLSAPALTFDSAGVARTDSSSSHLGGKIPRVAMNFMEVARVALFFIEWIWTAVVAFIFPDKLIGKVPGLNGGNNVCHFDRQLDLSRCRFGLAWGLIAFLILSATIMWYSLDFCTSLQLPANVEVVIFSWLTLWWVCSRLAACVIVSWTPTFSSCLCALFAPHMKASYHFHVPDVYHLQNVFCLYASALHG